MRWFGDVVHIVQKGSWWGNLKERDRMEDIGVDMGIILKYKVKEKVWMACTGFMWLRKGSSDDLCEKARSAKCGEFL